MMWVYQLWMAFALQSSLTNLVATLLRLPVINALHSDYEASFTTCPVCSYNPTPEVISSKKYKMQLPFLELSCPHNQTLVTGNISTKSPSSD
jgi:hypothetical protein